MKKYRYFAVLIVFVILVPIILFVYLKVRPTFPHYKQVFLQHNGCIIRSKNAPIILDFVIFDEKEKSEMEHKLKIKSVDLIDSGGGAITLSKWSVGSNLLEVFQGKDYITRTLQAEISLAKEGITEFIALNIRYVDDKVESYSIGSVKADIRLNEFMKEHFADNTITAQLINAVGDTPYPVSGLLVELDFREDKEIVINNIDLGIKGFEVDYNNIHMEYGTVTTLDILKMRESSPPAWLKPFDSLNMDANQASVAPIPLTLANNYPNDSEEKRVTLFIPLICTDTEYLKTINVFCVSLSAEIDGNEKIIHVGNHWSLTRLPAEGVNINPVKLLKEQGK